MPLLLTVIIALISGCWSFTSATYCIGDGRTDLQQTPPPPSSSPKLSNNCSSRAPAGGSSHVTLLLQLIKVLKWDQVIIFFDTLHSDDLQFLLPNLRTTSLHDLSDLQQTAKVRQLLQQLYKKFYPKLHFLLLSSYSTVMELLHDVEQFDLQSNRTLDFRHHSFWIAGSSSQCQPETSVLPHIQQMENVVLICPGMNGDQVLLQLQTVTGGRAPNRDIETMKKKRDVFPNTRYGLNNRTLTVSVVVSPPFVRKTLNGFEGYYMDILDTIANSLNFSYEIVHPEGMRWGVIVDGRWDGLVGQLERREIDLAVEISINEDREEVMDFLYPPIQTQIDDIMYRLPSDDEEKWQIYLRPFHSLVLLILLVILVLLTLIILGAYKVTMRRRTRALAETYPVITLADVIVYLFGVLLNRAPELQPKRQFMRMILFTWGVFSVIIAACYSANLVSSFTVQKPDLPFTSLGELVRQKEYKWGFVSGNIREHIFKGSKAGDMKLAWEGVIELNKTDPDVLSENEDHHIDKVKSEKYAFFTSRNKIEKAEAHDCKIRHVGHTLIWHQVGIGVPTDYPLKRELEDVLTVIADSGLLEIWWRRWFRIQADQCNQDDSVTSLDLRDVSSAFYLLCVGVGGAWIILVIEIMKYKLT